MENSADQSGRSTLLDAGRGLVRRHPYLTALAILLVVVRIALPYVLRPVLEDQVSALLNGRIEIEDVDLALLRGEVVVEGVRLVETGMPDPSPVSFAKLLANVRWVALPFGQAVIEEIRLVSPRIHVVRAEDGAVNLGGLPATTDDAPAATVEPTPSADAESGWPVGLTRLVLEDATVVFSDHTLDGFEDVEFRVDLLEIERGAYGGPIYDQGGKITLVSQLAGAPLKIEASFDSEILRATSNGTFSAKGLNVGLGAPYAAQMLGWRDLQGLLDLEIDFSADDGRARSPRIVLDLHDFLIVVDGEEEPALAWDSLRVAIDSIDPEANFVSVSEIVLSNLAVRLRPADDQPLVVLSKVEADPAGAADANAPASEVGEPESAAAGPSNAGDGELRWRVAKLVIDQAHVIVEAPDDTLDVGLQVEVGDLSNEAGSQGRLQVSASVGGGALDVSGVLTVVPPGFDGAVSLAELSLASVLAVVPDPTVELLRAGVARSDLQVRFAMTPDGDGGSSVDASVSGTVGLAGLEVAADDANEFSLKWKDLAIAIDGIDVRGGALATDDGSAPIRIAGIDLVAPLGVATRLADGTIALPPQLVDDSAAPVSVDEDNADPAGGGAEAPAVELARFRLTKGAVRLTDRSVEPATRPGLNEVRLAVDDVRVPGPQIGRLDFSATGLKGGLLTAKGKVDGEATDVVLTLDKYRLAPYDPYAATFSGYGIRSGMLTVESTVRLQGDDFDTHTKVIVHRLGIKNTNSVTEFEDQVGVPISLAIALLKDTQGDIKIDLPVSGSGDETSVGVGAVVGQQLRRILINALASPLKLFGVGGGGDEGLGGLSAARIGFAEGSQSLSAEGRAKAERLAELLRDRPDLAIRIDVINSLRDVRPLQEASLLAELDERPSLDTDFGAIRAYLRARSTGDPKDTDGPELPQHLEPVLDDLLSHRRPPAQTIAALSASRADLVRKVMLEELQVRPRQVIVEEALNTGLVDGPPVVEAALGVVEGDSEVNEDDDAPTDGRGQLGHGGTPSAG